VEVLHLPFVVLVPRCDFGTNVMDLPKNRLCGDDSPNVGTENPSDDCRLPSKNRTRQTLSRGLILPSDNTRSLFCFV
jgi:hypothetical protein